MKKLIYAVIALFLLASCEDFLDTENYVKKDTSNFPSTIEDLEQAVVGVYSVLNLIQNDPHESYYYFSELAADDRFGGGGDNDKAMQGFDKIMNTQLDMMGKAWSVNYKGIYRVNSILEGIDMVEETFADGEKENILRQIHFLRAFFYHNLAEAFENVPLVLSTESENLPQAPVDELYGQIGYDLKKAIEVWSTNYTNETNRITKWDAEALMARVFLFYTGFYQKESMPLGDGEGNVVGTITKAEVISWLEDCINNSGHRLLDDFRELWAYSNEHTAPYYNYLLNEAPDVRWAGDDNDEKMFSIATSTMTSWDNAEKGYSNQFALHFSLRAGNGFEGTFPFGRGWGAGPVNKALWDEWASAEPNDLRRQASIVDVNTECTGYLWGQDTQLEETGYWSKKLIVTQGIDNAGERWDLFTTIKWGAKNDVALGYCVDLTLIRFADVLLMHSELKQDIDGINRVRDRVGLPRISVYSDEALRRERRFELCFEGRRWADIRRWHIAETVLDNQLGVSIRNGGVDATMKAFGGGYSSRYKATRGFFKIPETQITLSEGVLKQNNGWGSEAEYPGWN